MIREGNIGLRQLYCYLTFILLATGGTVVMTLPMSVPQACQVFPATPRRSDHGLLLSHLPGLLGQPGDGRLVPAQLLGHLGDGPASLQVPQGSSTADTGHLFDHVE